MLRVFFFISTFLILDLAQAKKIVFLGDSLTEGYGVASEAAFPQLIQKKIFADKLQWTVISSGSSGSTSASTLSRMKWVTKDKPEWVLILMGSNDGLRGLKIEETEKNLGEALNWAHENKINVILGQLYVPPNYGKDYFKKFSELFPRLAKKYNVKLAPFLLDKVAGIASLNQVDGIHPNEKGHVIVADNIYRYLKKEILIK